MEDMVKKYFKKKASITDISREQLIKALLRKHENILPGIEKEVKTLRKEKKALEKDRDKARKERDKLNDEVQKYKEKREELHKQANEKRREFFVIMEKLDDLEKLDDVVDKHKKKLEEYEWKLQTTAITTTDEKKLLDRMHEIYSQLTRANKESQEKLGIQEKLVSLAVGIKNLLAEAESYHEELMKTAAESDKYHRDFTKTGKKLSARRIKLRGIERKLKNHQESIGYWKDWVGGGKK